MQQILEEVQKDKEQSQESVTYQALLKEKATKDKLIKDMTEALQK